MRHIAQLVVTTFFLLVACTSDQPPSPTPSPTPTPEVPATPRPVFTPIVTPTPSPVPGPPRIEIVPAVFLVDLANNESITLFEDDEETISGATFDADGLPVVSQWRAGSPLEVTFDLDGNELSRAVRTSTYPCARIDDDTIEVNGRRFDDIECGLISPDGRRMLYNVAAEPLAVTATYEVPTWDQWLIDLDSDERNLLHAGMRHCGGCDGRFGPAWSPSERYVYFAELIQGGDVLLTDTETLQTRPLTSDAFSTDIKQRPIWSPISDQLLHPTAGRSATLSDLTYGAVIEFEGPTWPAAFDPTGRYLYFTLYEEPNGRNVVTVVDLQTYEVVGTRAGVIPWLRLWGAGGPSLVAVEDGFVAALEDTSNCFGTVVYPSSGGDGTCVRNGRGAVFSPDGSQVAIAVRGKPVIATYMQGRLGGTMWNTDIVIVDVETGVSRIVAEGAYSDHPPAITWNQTGTHILVRWPAQYGV